MTFRAVIALCVVSVAMIARPASAVVPTDPTELAEAYFNESERFDAFLTYENRRGPLRVLFTISRRWRDGLAELLFDVREPSAFREYALLAKQTRAGSDDLFVYLPDGPGFAGGSGRRVRRLSAPSFEREAVYQIFALGDFRPFAKGELLYEAAPDETIEGTPCRVVSARPAHDTLGFTRIELAFAADTGLLLESRFFRDSQQFRRVSIAPGDYETHDGRRIPMRRTARSWANAGETEMVLVSLLATPDLPDELFSHKNLIVQRFPEF